MDPQQLWLFELPSEEKEMKKKNLSLSEEECRELGNMFAELLINHLNKKQEDTHADNNIL
jgi:hypothetical protein